MVGSAWSESARSSWARHRFVAASSLNTGENVASRRGSGRHCLKASRARALSESLLTVSSAQSTNSNDSGTHLKKHLTTCFRSLTVCWSTSCVTILLSTVPTA